MASNTIKVDGREVLRGSEADPNSPRYDPNNAVSRAKRGVIAVSNLNQSPTPIKVPSALPSTEAAGLEGSLQAQADAFTKNLEAKAATAGTAKDTSLEALLAEALGTPGQTELTADLYSKKGGVDESEAALKETNQQLLEEQESLRRRMEALDKNTQGLEPDAIQGEKERLTRESLSKQADLSVIALARQGKYDSAKAIADRAVAVKMEQGKRKLDALNLIYQDAKDTFTTAEQRQFESAQDDRKRKLDDETFKERARFEQLIRQSDPLYQAQLANTYSQIDARNAAASNQYGTLNGKPQTATQSQVQGYAERTNQADIIIGTIGSKFTGAKSIVGALLPNILKTSERQQYEQAQRNFVNAVLRRESGAVISDEEFANARMQYFPQPGDAPEVVSQKEANRQTVIDNLFNQSNVPRTAIPGQIIEDADGTRYEIGDDGETLTAI